MAVIIEVLQPVQQSGVVQNSSVVVDVLVATQTPSATLGTSPVIESVAPGGTVANISWGLNFPSNPVEGQIFIKVTP